MSGEKRYPRLCDADRCTACSACYSVCPRGAIAMREDAHGELHPAVDADACVGCGLCERTCPENGIATVERRGKPTVYCCWLKDEAKRRESTSGGAAYAISAFVIEQGGRVWGAAYDENMSVRYTEADTLEALGRIQKSKYVQSYVGDAFKAIKKELDRGDLVLFAGTGCHVKGLRAYLRKDYENLIAVDIVCHGVPGQGVFMKYKDWLERRYHDKLVDYQPRYKGSDGKEAGYASAAIFKERGLVMLERRDNAYFTGFQRNLFLRPNCFDCHANGEERYSDITVADFWGLGRLKPFEDYKQRALGISMLALNNEKARNLFNRFSVKLVFEERTYREASLSNAQYYRSVKPSPLRDLFRSEYPDGSWDYLAGRYMRLTAKESLQYWLKKLMPSDLLSYIKHKVKWIK